MIKKFSRRKFLKNVAIGTGFALTGFRFPIIKRSSALSYLSRLPDKPNFLFIITDQERYTQYFPEGWEQENLPNLTRLKNNGLTFTNAFCNTCMCSPSRSTFLTGLYPAQHLVTDTLPEAEGEPNTNAEHELDPNLQNMAKMLKSVGYSVYYKGKWHVSKPQGDQWTVEDLAVYGFDEWDPPDAGEDLAPENYGGGRANHDQRFVDDAVSFLQNVDMNQPFALFVSLVNPHDVSAYPDKFENDYNETMLTGDINLPPTVYEDLENNFKPKAHAQLLNKLNIGLGSLTTIPKKKHYVNFYGNLLKHVDQQIGKVLDALSARGDGQTSLADNTIIFRLADHGEMGLSHGGLRQKMFVAYEEAIHIPLIVSNPILFPIPQTSDALVSLVDIMPTIATLIDLPNKEEWVFKGVDFSSIIQDPSIESVQDTILFTFDDIKAGMEKVNSLVDPPNRLRCIREKKWKFVKYFDQENNVAPEYEMYDLENDHQELENLAHPNHPRYNDQEIKAQRERLMNKLAAMEEEKLQPLVTAIHTDKKTTKPTTIGLSQNYPNPFNSTTKIRFSIPQKQHVTLKIFDSLGREIETLIDRTMETGYHIVQFTASNLPSGTYYCQLRCRNVILTRKMTFVK